MEVMNMNWLKTRFAAYGFLLGTAGVKLLSTPEAKKAYTKVTAAALRGKDEVLKQYTKIRENCEDIAADAKEINEAKKKEELARKISEAKAFLASVEEKE